LSKRQERKQRRLLEADESSDEEEEQVSMMILPDYSSGCGEKDINVLGFVLRYVWSSSSSNSSSSSSNSSGKSDLKHSYSKHSRNLPPSLPSSLCRFAGLELLSNADLRMAYGRR